MVGVAVDKEEPREVEYKEAQSFANKIMQCPYFECDIFGKHGIENEEKQEETQLSNDINVNNIDLSECRRLNIIMACIEQSKYRLI